jgi:hypothetical protein
MKRGLVRAFVPEIPDVDASIPTAGGHNVIVGSGLELNLFD